MLSGSLVRGGLVTVGQQEERWRGRTGLFHAYIELLIGLCVRVLCLVCFHDLDNFVLPFFLLYFS